MAQYDVFISYSRKDTAIANEICVALNKVGISYFIDKQGISGGLEFPDVLADAICNCKIFLFLASENSYNSKFTKSEIIFAFNKKDSCSLLPYIIDDSELPPALALTFASINWRNTKDHPISTILMDDLLILLGRARNDTDSQYYRNNVNHNLHKNHIISDIVEGLVNAKMKEIVGVNSTSTIETSHNINGFTPKWSADASETEKKVILSILRNMIFVKGGTMILGATEEQLKWAHRDEKPAHPVELSSYWMNKFTVTQFEWETIMKSIPSPIKKKGANLPIEWVSLIECRKFVRRLIDISNIDFALPTEAQWEYAARGGVNNKGLIYSGSDNFDEVGWCYGPNSPHEVGLKKPNELGLYDMSGNVAEWCDEEKGKYKSSAVKNPHNHYKPSIWTEGTYIVRGGKASDMKTGYRVSYRSSITPMGGCLLLGFRLVINTNN